ncbi:MAG: peroxiredoxin [Candidatus Nanopelagicales bacterium]
MTIAVGDAIPDVTIRIVDNGMPSPTTSRELLGNGRVVLFAVPGAFTPTCSKEHLPSYVETAAELSSAGVDRIVCIATNDPFVMSAWAQVEGVGDDIIMASDGNGEFTEAIGQAVDASGFGLGTRSKRYAMVIEDGVVTQFMPEADGFSAVASLGSCVVDALKS